MAEDYGLAARIIDYIRDAGLVLVSRDDLETVLQADCPMDWPDDETVDWHQAWLRLRKATRGQ